MSAEAGTPRHLFPADLARNWPDWSADVRSISYSVEHGVGGSSTTDGRFLAAVSEDMPVVKVLDLRTRHCSEVARRRGISFPVWSADSILYFQDLLTPRACLPLPTWRCQASTGIQLRGSPARRHDTLRLAIPGMGHCFGGGGCNSFDKLAALVQCVVRALAYIVAQLPTL